MRSTIQRDFALRRWFAVLVIAVSCFAQAQSKTATITGTVTDDTGAVIPKAEIALEVTNGPVLRTVTDPTGHFALEAEPGESVLKISSPGFMTVSIKVRLSAATSLSQNVKLPVAGIYDGPVISESLTLELLNVFVTSTLPLRPLPPLKLHTRKPTSLR
jgi:Carboxypeptidase regulatory-like domain